MLSVNFDLEDMLFHNGWSLIDDTGDVVLMVDPGNPRGHWPLDRIQEVFPGPDGKVRVVRVRTGDQDYVRPIKKLCPLEIKRGRKDQNGILVEGEDVPANAWSLTPSPNKTLHARIEEFIVEMINKLDIPGTDLLKYADNTSISETICKNQDSHI